MLRKIVRIDEERCDGCGLCVPSCAEGAIQIIDGKARLVSEVYCDGLGACLGECPRDAISIVEREARPFDEAAAHRHVSRLRAASAVKAAEPLHACPGAAAQVLQPAGSARSRGDGEGEAAPPSALANWPVQLTLVPVRAPYFDQARLLISADCVPFALADFHSRFLAGRTVVMGCPKLDKADLYLDKLTQIFSDNNLASIDVVYMEVPCCSGLVQLTMLALEASGKDIPLRVVKISTRGEVLAVQEHKKKEAVKGIV